MKKVILLLIYLNTTLLLGQQQPSKIKHFSENIIKSWDEAEPGKTKNSYYLNAEWASFDLFLKSGCLVEGQLMRLNLFTNKFEVKFGTKIKVLDTNKVEYFEFNDNGTMRLFESVPGYGLEGHLRHGFFEVIVAGDPGLLLKVYLENSKASAKKDLLNQKKKHKFIKKESYFLLHNGMYSQIPTNKKEVYSFFENRGMIVSHYIKKNKLDLNNRKDLKKLILFIKS